MKRLATSHRQMSTRQQVLRLCCCILREIWYTVYVIYILQFDIFCAILYLWKKRLFYFLSSGCASLHGLFFLQKFRKSHRQRPTSRGCEKSDKNLHLPENMVYYIQELRKEKFPQYIRRICRRVRSFLCFRNPRCLCRQRGFCILLPVKSGILYV